METVPLESAFPGWRFEQHTIYANTYTSNRTFGYREYLCIEPNSLVSRSAVDRYDENRKPHSPWVFHADE